MNNIPIVFNQDIQVKNPETSSLSLSMVLIMASLHVSDLGAERFAVQIKIAELHTILVPENTLFLSLIFSSLL